MATNGPKASVETMWDQFRKASPSLAEETTYSAWYFCDNERDANELAQLVLNGQKRATAGSLWAYQEEQEPTAKPGDFSVITDWEGEGICVIRTTEVEIVPFDEVTAEFAAAEGEGDRSLEYWRRVHEDAFTRELESMGKRFDCTMPVVCERFEVVFRP